MSVTDKTKSGGLSATAQSGEPVAGVPIKKRPLWLFEQPSSLSPSAVSSHSGAAAANFGTSTTAKVGTENECAARTRTQLDNLQDAHSAEQSSCPSSRPAGTAELPKFRAAVNDRMFVVKQEQPDHPLLNHSPQVQDSSATATGKNGSSSRCLKTPVLDLNVSLGTWDHLDGIALEHDPSYSLNKMSGHEHAAAMALNHGGMSTKTPNNPIAACPAISQQVPGSFSIAFGESALKSSVALDTMSCSTLSSAQTALSLDLQLKLPSRPELGKEWKLEHPPDLSLSLFGKENEPPPGLVKPEPREHVTRISTTKSGDQNSELVRDAQSELDHFQKEASTSIAKYQKMALTCPSLGATAAKSLSSVSNLKNEPVEERGDFGCKTQHLEESSSSQALSERSNIRTNPSTSNAPDIDLNAEMVPENSESHSAASDGDDVGAEGTKNTKDSTNSNSLLTSVQTSSTPQLVTQFNVPPRGLEYESENSLKNGYKKLLKVEVAAAEESVSAFLNPVGVDTPNCAAVQLPVKLWSLASMSQGSTDMDCSDDDDHGTPQARKQCKALEPNVHASEILQGANSHVVDGVQESSSSCAAAEVCLDALRNVNGSASFEASEVKDAKDMTTLPNFAGTSENSPSSPTAKAAEASTNVETLNNLPNVPSNSKDLCQFPTLEASTSYQPSHGGSMPCASVATDGDCHEPKQEHTADGSCMQSQMRVVESTVRRLGNENPETDEHWPSPLQNNERVTFVDRPFLLSNVHQHVNRNERWDRFMGSELKSKNCRGRDDMNAMASDKRPDQRDAAWGRDDCGSPKYRFSKRFQAYEMLYPGDQMADDGSRLLQGAGEQYPLPHFQRRRLLTSVPMDGPMPRGMMRDDGSPARFAEMEMIAREQEMARAQDPMLERLYEQADKFLVRQPPHQPMRREFPLHLRRGRSPPPEVLGHMEMMQCGPPFVRSGRLGHAYRQPFPREMLVERRGSPPPFGSRMPVDGWDPTDLQGGRSDRSFEERRPYLRRAPDGSGGNRDEILNYVGEGELMRRNRGSKSSSGRSHRPWNGGAQDSSYRARSLPWRNPDGSKRRRY